MIKLISAIVLALSVAACSTAATGDHANTTVVPPLLATSTASPQVTVLAQQLTMPGLNRQRTVRIYVPPGYASSTKRYPVLYMHDGQNLFDKATAYAGEWGVDETLDSLAQTQGLELIVVGIDNGGDKRVTELNPWDHARFGKGEGKRYMDFIVNVVKPMVDANYRTRPEREHTGVMGSSMGGLMAHYALLQYPQVFSKAGIFSPAYWLGSEVFGLTANQAPAPDARLALYMGGGEGHEAVTDYQRMVAQLRRQPHAAANLWVKLTPGAAHNEGAWRAEFAAAVTWMFAPDEMSEPRHVQSTVAKRLCTNATDSLTPENTPHHHRRRLLAAGSPTHKLRQRFNRLVIEAGEVVGVMCEFLRLCAAFNRLHNVI